MYRVLYPMTKGPHFLLESGALLYLNTRTLTNWGPFVTWIVHDKR